MHDPKRDDRVAVSERIALYQPDLSGNERAYVMECVDSSWISSKGKFVEQFERAFTRLTGVPHAVTVSNGTVALHLALHCLGIGPGDEVIVPTFTFIASVNTIAQTGATPVFAECRQEDWLIDPEDVARRITPRTKAIVAVHLYGAACDMAALLRLAKDHGLVVVEDCAEALGATAHGRHVGSFGDVGTFSFFGNKTLTTGEGGMVVTTNADLARRLRLVKGQGQSPDRYYWHSEMGFNYRMSNICAAIGLAQAERFEQILARKRTIADIYRRALSGLELGHQKSDEGAEHAAWLFSFLVPEGVDRDRVMLRLDAKRIETRPFFGCAHLMPMYAKGLHLPVSEAVSRRGLSLPSYPALTDGQVEYVADQVRQAMLKD